jgi:hypothetical protein
MWSASELNTLVAMRVISMSYPECGEVLSRSAASCGSAVFTNNLYQIINDLRKEKIKGALQSEHCIQTQHKESV